MAKQQTEQETQEGAPAQEHVPIRDDYRMGEITSENEFQDPDEIALQEARAEVAAEAAQGTDETITEHQQALPQAQPRPGHPGEPGAAPGQQQETAEQEPDGQARQDQGGKAKPGMIPQPRFDEVAARAYRAEAQAAYLAGVVSVLQQGRGNGQQPATAAPQPPQPTPAERIAAARQSAIEAADKFDRGEITARQFEESRQQAEDQIWQIRDEARQAEAARAGAPSQQQRPQVPTSSLGDQQVLDAQMEQLHARHPHLLRANEDQLRRLAAQAWTDARAIGQPITEDDRGTYRLRQMVADLSDVMLPYWYPDQFGPGAQAQPANGQQQPAPGQTGQQPRPLTRQQQATADKLRMAAEMPVNPQQLGTAGQGGGLPTDQDIEAMSEDDIAALPPSVRARWLETDRSYPSQ